MSGLVKRITIITGHYGSGKTELAVNLAVKAKEKSKAVATVAGYGKTALIDLDVANPYFRSRERQAALENLGISVYSNTFGFDISADLPAIAASVRAPLEDRNTFAVIDAGGNDSGARVLNQFRKYFGDESAMLFVINANRPETSTFEGAAGHLVSVMEETGLEVGGIVNNTHMLGETGPKDVIKGYELCRSISESFGIPLVWNCCSEGLRGTPDMEAAKSEYGLDLLPLTIYMRASWMDNSRNDKTDVQKEGQRCLSRKV